MRHDLPSFAVLIDADNVRLESVSPILEEITRHARAKISRLYAARLCVQDREGKVRGGVADDV